MVLKFVLSGALLLCGAGMLCAAPVLKVSADREEALYKVGEPFRFLIELTDDGKPLAGEKIYCNFIGEETARGRAEVTTDAAGKAEVSRTFGRPGFIRCAASAQVGGKKVSASGGAGAEPEKIVPARPEPADFDAYWAGVKAELNAMPLKVKLTQVEPPQKGGRDRVKVYDFEINMPSGRPVRGYLAMPSGAAAKSLPAQVSFHGAGVRGSSMPVGTALKGRIAIDINAHGIENGKPKEYYENLLKGDLRSYRYDGRTSRDTIYFRGMYQRIYRTLQFVKSLPEWDGRTLIAVGTSQGGGQALVAAGIDPDVTCCVAYVPALCDHGGFAVGRESGWPRFHKEEGGTSPEVMTAADYIDAVNFARKITGADTVLTTGFIDLSCTPSSVFAAYNVIPSGSKQIWCSPPSDHSVPREFYSRGDEFIRRHVEKMKQGK